MDMIVGFFNSGPAWIAAVTGIVTACTAITALTPTKSDDKIINFVLKMLNLLSGNIGKNKNADSE
jgi:uncharacterized membrane protein|tara:strand:- start:504 stop:698 length:195 start_codon:yes stop_codon:yes gene_type:complete